MNNAMRSIAKDICDMQPPTGKMTYPFVLNFVSKVLADWTDDDFFRRPVNLSVLYYCAEEAFYNE